MNFSQRIITLDQLVIWHYLKYTLTLRMQVNFMVAKGTTRNSKQSGGFSTSKIKVELTRAKVISGEIIIKTTLKFVKGVDV